MRFVLFIIAVGLFLFTVSSSAQTKPTTTPSTRPATRLLTPKKPGWKLSDKLQVKWGGTWREATIVKFLDDWTLVEYSPGKSREWVEPWRMRRAGSTEEPIGYATPNGMVIRNAGPPRPRVGPSPAEKAAEEAKADAARASAPANAGDKGASEQAPAEPPKPAGFDKPVTAVDRTGCKDAQLQPASTNWVPAVDPVNAKQLFTSKPITLRGGNRGTWEKMIDRFSNAGRAGIVYEGGAQLDDKSRRFEKINLASGASEGLFDLVDPTHPKTISPAGLVSALGWDPSDKDHTRRRIDIWKCEGSAMKQVVSFVPFETAKISHGDFIDETHLLVSSESNEQLICFEVPAAKAIWQLNLSGRATIAFSNGRKYLFIATSDALTVFDPLKGEAITSLGTQGRSLREYSISADGTKLVSLDSSVLSVWDLQTGKLADEIGMPAGIPARSIQCLTERFVLLDDSTLFDLKKLTPVWKYTGATGEVTSHGGRAWYIFGKDHPTLSNTKLPHPAAIKAADAAKPGEMLVKSGEKVSLEISIDASDEQKKKIRDAIEQQLSAAGITVEDGRPVKLIARTQDGASENRTYRKIGPGGGGEENVTVTQKVTRLFFEFDGKPVWETSTTNSAGFFLQMQKDQSVSDAAKSQFNIGFLETMRVPTKVLKLTQSNLGTSQLVLAGPKDLK